MSEQYEIIPYEHNQDIEVIHYNGDVWMSQKDMAEIFGTSIQNVGKHIKRLESEASEDFLNHQFKKSTGGRAANYYPMHVIMYVGFNTFSTGAIKFQTWAVNIIKEYATKGYVVSDEHIDQAAQSIRAIRTSEASFSKKILAIFANSSDYDKDSPEAQNFFATVQNKIHYSVHGHTAAELIASRAQPQAPNMGLQSFKGNHITLADARVAKNYLYESELQLMANLTEQFLLYAESTEIEGKTLTMRQWIDKLNQFIRVNDKLVLQSKGTISAKDAEQLMRDAYNQFKGKS